MQKQWASYLLVVSLVANVILGGMLYGRDHHLNRVTWGNAVTDLWKHIDWASHDITARSDGRVTGSAVEGLRLATADLDELQYLPLYRQRVTFEDISVLRHFLRYAEQAHALAVKEQGDTGQVSQESRARLQKIHDGLELTLKGNTRTNDLANSDLPWNHGAWRKLWQEIAEGLRQMEFVPLPD